MLIWLGFQSIAGAKLNSELIKRLMKRAAGNSSTNWRQLIYEKWATQQGIGPAKSQIERIRSDFTLDTAQTTLAHYLVN